MRSVLVTGCSGLVGVNVVELCLSYGWEVIGVDKNKSENLPEHNNFKFYQLDLTVEKNLINVFVHEDFEMVLNCFGVKGSPIRAKTQPVDFLYPTMKINTELIQQCYLKDVFLVYVSSVGVYGPTEKFTESHLWDLLPSEADWFPSWSKRFGEIMLEAYERQYNYTKWAIIRPANIYGEYDDFSGNGTVISSTIKKIVEAKDDKIVAWGDGSPIRDFVYAHDVAQAIIDLGVRQLHTTINFGSGEEITIKSMIEELIKISNKNLTIEWDTTKPNGDLRRQMDTDKQKECNLLPRTSFKNGLKNTYYHYINKVHKNKIKLDRDKFFETGYYVGNIDEIFQDKSEFNDFINELKTMSENKKDYVYRFEYNHENTEPNYVNSVKTKEEIDARDKHIKENGYRTIQRWWETFGNGIHNDLKKKFRRKIENFIFDVYPDLSPKNITYNDNFTIYENGDFIEMHQDGFNANRKCVILIYLSDENDYNNGGGELVIDDNGTHVIVKPVNTNFAMLEFEKNNIGHAVKSVTNDFVRYTYIAFVEKGEERSTKKIL